LTACSGKYKLLNENAIAKIIPDDIKNEMSVKNVTIDRRQTNDKEDIVFAVIDMENDNIHHTAYYTLYINYYDTGGWMLDSWKSYQADTFYPVNPPDDGIAYNTVIREIYDGNITLKSADTDNYESGSCTYVYEFEKENEYWVSVGIAIIECVFLEKFGNWESYVDSVIYSPLKPPDGGIIYNTEIREIYDGNITLKSTVTDNYEYGSCTYLYEFENENKYWLSLGIVTIECVFLENIGQWESYIDSVIYSPLKPPSDDMAHESIRDEESGWDSTKSAYRSYTATLVSTDADNYKDGYCTYTFELKNEHPYLTELKNAIVSCFFSEYSGEWSSYYEIINESINWHFDKLIGKWENASSGWDDRILNITEFNETSISVNGSIHDSDLFAGSYNGTFNQTFNIDRTKQEISFVVAKWNQNPGSVVWSNTISYRLNITTNEIKMGNKLLKKIE
jgi:hypothetical protein